MKRNAFVYPRIDYKQHPSSYWNDETLDQAILKNIKGDFRREEIRKALAAGNMEAIPEEILQEALSENVRSFTGRIHPRFMGGEYLPRTSGALMGSNQECGRSLLSTSTTFLAKVALISSSQSSLSRRISCAISLGRHSLNFKSSR